MTKFISYWFILLFLIWLFGFLFRVKYITDTVNPYYTNILLIIGYVTIYLYNKIIRNYTYETSYLLYEVTIHIAPFIISYYLVNNKFKNNMGKTNLLIVVFLYIHSLWMIGRYKWRKEPLNPIDIYFKDKHPTSWNEFKKMCIGKGGICKLL